MKPIAIYPPEPGLSTDWWCEWGPLTFARPTPSRDQVGPLMLITPSYLAALLRDGPHDAPGDCGGVHSVTVDGRRVFAQHAYAGRRWTWELFPAYFADQQGPPIIVGRWPD